MKVEKIRTVIERKVYRFTADEIEAILFAKIASGREFRDECRFYGEKFNGAAIVLVRENAVHSEDDEEIF